MYALQRASLPSTPTEIEPAGVVVELRATPLLVEAHGGPLPIDAATAALGRLEAHPAPVKVVRPAGAAPRLLAELPNEGDLDRVLADAQRAIARAVAWLAGKEDGGPDGEAADPRRITEALRDSGWGWADAGGGCRRVIPPAEVTSMKLLVMPLADGAVRVAAAALPLRIAHPRAVEAVRRFALEAGARLRLVRFAVSGETGGVLHVARDVILPASVPLERWIVEAVHALARAQTETARALRALGQLAVAEAYLATHAPEE
jgi:hypothetical protein